MPPVVVFCLGSGRGAAPPSLTTTSTSVSGKASRKKSFGLVLDLHRERIAGFGEAQDDRDFPVRGGRMFDESARNDVLSRFGMDDRCEQAFDFFFHAVRKVCL